MSISTSDLTSLSSSASGFVEQEVLEKLHRYRPKDPKDDTVKVLHAFLEHLGKDGRENLLEDLHSLQTDEEINQHATTLVEGLLFPLRAHSKTPSITISARFGVEDSIENIAAALDEPAARKDQTWLKTACLRRDDYKCCLSGARDPAHKRNSTEIIDRTNCAHIIPFCIGNWTNETEQNAVAKIWVSLNRCFPSLRSRIGLTQSSINEPRNAITMTHGLHVYFGTFDFALEALREPNSYRIKVFDPQHAFVRTLPSSGIVTFEQHDARYQLPSPELLFVHATIAKILHATGKAQEADNISRDKDSTGVMARDGSTDITRLLSTTSIGFAYSQIKDPHPSNVHARPATMTDDGTQKGRKQRSINKKKENVS
ncbi:hypothetical protein BO70DRAFT_357361 [Aspergillus heteromorphus CBS 117.55]|uniref:HNH nuclease domain-containing protein n=1 Tax=Aspergillus heteromorphus CBS 117.55 TaxID=1448321 RepID=A0A317X3Y9_9EURO|nr:uncharacterized protein BO70DRAFT_357361 [Aspergillus heteromorphus CBS 117.55]PWY92227.1 hypothetical protein BO70DRAFT_357361 [Aspergillus heteromorphus CBS 117.55]